MKKVICGIAVSIILVACMMAGTLAADDSTDRAFGFKAGTVYGTTDEFGYAQRYYKKLSTKNYIEVRHSVSESAAGYTNLIAAHKQSGKYIGQKWMKPDSIYHSTTGGCAQGSYYAPCGRGNTLYSDNLSLTEVTISGQFKVH